MWERNSVDSSFLDFALVAVIYGAGIGLASPPATEIIVSSLPLKSKELHLLSTTFLN